MEALGATPAEPTPAATPAAALTCFVTGGTGFVGGHLCERLAREGHRVIALARPDSKTSLLESCGARIVRGGVESTNVIARHVEGADIFFHLAGVTRTHVDRRFFEVNTRGMRSVLRGLHRGDFGGRLVVLSSLAAGGPATASGQPRTEEDADAPVSLYGESKHSAERLLRKLSPREYSWCILRPGAIYGPREHQIHQVLRSMKKSGFAFRVGRGLRVQLTHVEDVVEAMIRAATHPEAAGKTYNVTDRSVWTFGQVVTLASEVLRRRVRIIPLPLFAGTIAGAAVDFASRLAGRSLTPFGADKMRELAAGAWIASPARLERELEWRAKWSFPDGLRATVRWYEENGWLE